MQNIRTCGSEGWLAHSIYCITPNAILAGRLLLGLALEVEVTQVKAMMKIDSFAENFKVGTPIPRNMFDHLA